MNIGNDLDFHLNAVADGSLSTDERLSSLSFVLDYICNTNHPNEYAITTITLLLDLLEDPSDHEDEIIHLTQEVRQVLSLPATPEFSVVLSAENQLYQYIKKHFSDKWFIVPLSNVCLRNLGDYDFYIKADETDFPRTLYAKAGNAVFLDLYRVCYYEFLCYPMTYDVYLRYKESITAADTLITGMSYIRNALLPEFLPGKVCNISNSSQDLYYDLHCFKDAIRRNPNIRHVVIGLAPYSLRYDLSLTKNESERLRLFYYQARFGDTHNNTDLRDALQNYGKMYEQCIRLFGEAALDAIYASLVSDDVIQSERKSNLLFRPENLIPAEIAQMEAKYKKPYPETLAENKSILREYMQLASSKGIRISVFIPPVLRLVQGTLGHFLLKRTE